MNKKDLTKKEISDTFKKIKKHESEIKEYEKFAYRENKISPFEQKNVWIVSDSSTSFANFNHQNYA